ncbi:MAG: Gfo/Idh/MocA family protein [Candidatus Sumerlaeaceae bacterium]
MNRRRFLKCVGKNAVAAAAAGAAWGFPTIVSAAALGRDGKQAPSNRIVIGAIGLNWMGMANLEAFLAKEGVRVVALCDIEKKHLQNAQNKATERYGEPCETHHDFRELIARPDLDAVTLALPDHWHAIPAIMAARAGLDIYGEKPLSHTLEDGRAMCDAVKRYGRVWQTGSWQRSVGNFHRACELVRNGRLGKVTHVEVGLGQGYSDFDGTGNETAPRQPPDGFDYEMWLGPAPWTPYAPAKIHKNWRWNADYGGGLLTDWVGHHVDIAHWGLGLDETGPVEVEATGVSPVGLWNTPTDYDVHCKYANGITMQVSSAVRHGTKWIGEGGKWIFVDRGKLEASSQKILDEVIGPGEIRLTKSNDHYDNFLECVRSRKQTITPCEIAHRSTSVAHIGMVGIKVGRKLRWDPATELFDNDPEAQRLLGKVYRSPWRLEV